MKDKKVLKIDFSRKRYAKLADQFYNEGKYIPALRLAYKELEEFGGDAEGGQRFGSAFFPFPLPHGIQVCVADQMQIDHEHIPL